MNIKRFIIFFAILLLVVIFFPTNIFKIEEVSASGEYNVSGWAWSENIGWISFNSTNCDVDNNGYIDVACGGDNSTAPVVNYGVNVNASTGVFSGYAWSENIGWISFNRSDAGTPPASPYNGTETFIAKLDLSTNEVSGWARALAYGGGWDGWIKLRGSNYGVRLESSTNEFHGWAWGGNEQNGEWQKKAVVGWISFNCADRDICSQSNYKVEIVNQPPYVESPTVSGQEYCSISPTTLVSVQWTYNDTESDEQDQYNLQVATDENFNDIILDYTAFQTVAAGSIGTSAIRVVSSPASGEPEIAYTGAEETRYWRVSVHAATGNQNWSNSSEGPSFVIPAHAYPDIDFTWTPENPGIGEDTYFTDQTTFYDGGTSESNSWSWNWIIPDATYVNETTFTSQNPVVQFSSTSTKEVELQATDADGYSCSCSKEVGGRPPLPKWKEITPF